jgi:hypothetical protein
MEGDFWIESRIIGEFTRYGRVSPLGGKFREVLGTDITC